MVFGEIVEPSTRALIDDEFEDYPPYTKPELNWEGDAGIPSVINSLIFIEGSKIIKLFNNWVLNATRIHSQLTIAGIQIFSLEGNKYVVAFTQKDISTGEVIEELTEWLRKAQSVYAVLSEPISSYQNVNMSEKPETLIRVLSTKNDRSEFNLDKLESPNIVSGLGADVLSFCIHTGLNATLFMVYMDNTPLDSINTNSVYRLIQLLDLPVKKLSSNLNPPPSNLYL